METFSLLPKSGALTCLAVFAWLGKVSITAQLAGDRNNNNAMLTNGPTRFANVCLVTIAFMVELFMFLMFQSSAAFIMLQRNKAEKKGDDNCKAPNLGQIKYGGQGGRLILTGDRSVGNMLEQALPFLAALWLHAAFVDVSTAVWYGWGWMFFRLIYPVCFYYGPPYLFISTLPSYVLMGMLYWPAVTNLLNLLPQ